MFFDPTGIVLQKAPLFFPIVTSLGFNPLWLTIFFAINLELAFLTLPLGFKLFYVKGTIPKDMSMVHIYKSSTPFVLLMIVGLGLCMRFPTVITWSPGLVNT